LREYAYNVIYVTLGNAHTVKWGYSGQISAFSLNLIDIRVRIDLEVMSKY
jgi:hypothetical protein